MPGSTGTAFFARHFKLLSNRTTILNETHSMAAQMTLNPEPYTSPPKFGGDRDRGRFKYLMLVIGTSCFLNQANAQEYRPAPVPIFMGEAVARNKMSVADTPPKQPENASLPTGLQSFTLNAAIKQALDADPQIRAGLESIRQTEGDLITAGLLPNPELLIDDLMMPWGNNFKPTRQGGPTQIDAIVSYPIDWFIFGKRTAAIVAAEKKVDVATAQFANLIRQRISGTIASFYDVLEGQAMLDWARMDLDYFKQLESITAAQIKRGDLAAIELERVQLTLVNSRRELRLRKKILNAAISRLRAYMGFSEQVPITAQGDLTVPTPAKPLTAASAFALAEENRPDLIALRRQISMASANVKLEQANAYPSIKPGFGYTYQYQTEMAQANASSWNAIVIMTVPIFDRNQGNIAKAQSSKVQAQHNLRAQLVSLQAEIDQAVTAFQTAYDTLTIDAPGQLEAARKLRDKIHTAYQLGEKNLSEVLSTQRSYRDTFRLYIIDRSTYWHSLYALNATIGKQVLK